MIHKCILVGAVRVPVMVGVISVVFSCSGYGDDGGRVLVVVVE